MSDEAEPTETDDAELIDHPAEEPGDGADAEAIESPLATVSTATVDGIDGVDDVDAVGEVADNTELEPMAPEAPSIPVPPAPSFSWYRVHEPSQSGPVYLRAYDSDDAIKRFKAAQGIHTFGRHQPTVAHAPDHVPSAADKELDEILVAKLGAPPVA